jgi:hypothetical protein
MKLVVHVLGFVCWMMQLRLVVLVAAAAEELSFSLSVNVNQPAAVNATSTYNKNQFPNTANS